MASDAVLSPLRALSPVFRSGQAVEAGVSWRDLYRLRDEGELIELSRGALPACRSDRFGQRRFHRGVRAGTPRHGVFELSAGLLGPERRDPFRGSPRGPGGNAPPDGHLPPPQLVCTCSARPRSSLGAATSPRRAASTSGSPTLSAASSMHFGCAIWWGSRSRTPRCSDTSAGRAPSQPDSLNSRVNCGSGRRFATRCEFSRHEAPRARVTRRHGKQASKLSRTRSLAQAAPRRTELLRTGRSRGFGLQDMAEGSAPYG